jgi:hypothetical protein
VSDWTPLEGKTDAEVTKPSPDVWIAPLNFLIPDCAQKGLRVERMRANDTETQESGKDICNLSSE